MLITYKYQKILTRSKEILWKEHINQVKLWEKEDMDLEPKWKKEPVEKHSQEEEQKVEKNYLLNLCSKNDQIQKPKP